MNRKNHQHVLFLFLAEFPRLIRFFYRIYIVWCKWNFNQKMSCTMNNEHGLSIFELKWIWNFFLPVTKVYHNFFIKCIWDASGTTTWNWRGKEELSFFDYILSLEENSHFYYNESVGLFPSNYFFWSYFLVISKCWSISNRTNYIIHLWIKGFQRINDACLTDFESDVELV